MSTKTTSSSSANFFDKLYTGEGGIDFIGRRKTWYWITIVLIVISLGSMIFRGFELNIDFEGGTKISTSAGDLVEEEVGATFEEATGIEPELVQIVGSGDSRTLEIQSVHLTEEQAQAAQTAIAETHLDGAESVGDVGVSTVSESWGSTITERMILSMVVFLILAGIYVAVRLQRDMAIAALASLVLDGIIIAGIYSLFGLEVSPAVVIGLLTVLTFSIYDTVIVFDKVRENTAGVFGSRRATYAEQANLAVNQTVMRSLSTSIISALPIIALMVVAVWLMGVGTLRDLALIQLIGVIEGIFSSLFLATPMLVSIVNRKKETQEHNKAVEQYRASGGEADPHGDAEKPVDPADDEVAHTTKKTVTSPTSPAGPRSNTATWRPNRR